MQISPVVQPVEIQQVDFKTVEKVEKVKAETQDISHQEKAEQGEKFHELQSALAEHNISLDFSRDSETNQLVVKLVDNKTGEAIQQFPSEVSLKLTATFAKLQGQFVDGQY